MTAGCMICLYPFPGVPLVNHSSHESSRSYFINDEMPAICVCSDIIHTIQAGKMFKNG